MNKEEIIQSVKNYVRNKNERYALLINGAWGSGKTFLYENYLVNEIVSAESGKNERKTNIYISLYGISSVEELSKQLTANYLIYTKLKGNVLIEKGAKTIAGLLGMVSKTISFSTGNFSANFSETVQGISELIEAKNMIVCFDDLERCTIEINELFGYINNLIEHCNCKVIILADENNIGKMYANTNIEQKYQTILTGDRKVVENEDEEKQNENKETGIITIQKLKQINELLYSENYLYLDIKEKVIGKTCDYTPSMHAVLQDLIIGNERNTGCVVDENYKEFLIKYMDKIERAFEEAHSKNLRIIIAWIDMFKEFMRTLIKI